MNKPLKGFIAYAHEDTAAKNELRRCLAVMQQQNQLVTWHDGDITAGGKARQEHILKKVGDSDILLYLVSAWSLASENCNKELAEALRTKIRVIPVILESCDWLNHQLSDFEALPDEGKPISKWEPASDGWQNVVNGIRKAVEETEANAQKGGSYQQVFQQGNFLVMLGEIDKAIQTYSLAIELNPNCAEAYNNRGVIYGENHEFNRAIADFTKAIQLKPEYAEIRYNRGSAYSSKGELDRAITDFGKAIQLNPNFSATYYYRGNVFLNKGDVDCAIQDYNKAIRLDPDYAKAYNARGNAYKSKGDYNPAIVDYDRAIELKSDYMEAYNNRGLAYNEKGRT